MPKAIRNNQRFSIVGEPLYPHIKLTTERFPRLLATRLIANDGAEYFGAFLNRTNVRILIDFLNRTFKLRSCEIEIDGSFNHPCTIHYRRRCLAPCVADLIDEQRYQEMVALARLFLMNDRPLFRSAVRQKIDGASGALDFEIAAKWRDVLEKVEEFWSDERHAVWLDGTSDTYFARSTETGLDIFLITQKGRRVLGERVFSFEGAEPTDTAEAMSDVIRQFYRFHAPKEIRVEIELPTRVELQKTLSSRFARRVPIVQLTEKNKKVSTGRAIHRSTAELDIRRSIVTPKPRELCSRLKKDFRLRQTPKRIFAVDGSHISGTSPVVAMIEWYDGKVIESDYWLADVSGEPAAITNFLRGRFAGEICQQALLLIDGGTSQLNAAAKAVQSSGTSFVAAVKPPAEHFAISHFLTAEGRVDYESYRDTHRFLHRLRDDVHEFANAVHRDVRDYARFYEMSAVFPSLTETERRRILMAAGSASNAADADEELLRSVLGDHRARLALSDQTKYRTGKSTPVPPLVVPTRLQDPDGAAEDLIPIETGSRRPIRRQR
jgi:excinuclease ABC subunit C